MPCDHDWKLRSYGCKLWLAAIETMTLHSFPATSKLTKATTLTLQSKANKDDYYFNFRFESKTWTNDIRCDLEDPHHHQPQPREFTHNKCERRKPYYNWLLLVSATTTTFVVWVDPSLFSRNKQTLDWDQFILPDPGTHWWTSPLAWRWEHGSWRS